MPLGIDPLLGLQVGRDLVKYWWLVALQPLPEVCIAEVVLVEIEGARDEPAEAFDNIAAVGHHFEVAFGQQSNEDSCEQLSTRHCLGPRHRATGSS